MNTRKTRYIGRRVESSGQQVRRGGSLGGGRTLADRLACCRANRPGGTHTRGEIGEANGSNDPGNNFVIAVLSSSPFRSLFLAAPEKTEKHSFITAASQ